MDRDPASAAGAPPLAAPDTRRRLLMLLVVVFLVGAPAGVLRALCVGRSCIEPEDTAAGVPFCSLPENVRRGIQAGYREGRSPDVIAVTDDLTVGDFDGYLEPGATWPALARADERNVPLVFWGTGVQEAAELGDARLDAVAPTAARLLGLRRPHPEVRSGTALSEILDGARARLVVVVVWKGIGSTALERSPEAWPYLRSLLDEGAGTLAADTGALPMDPAATLTTIGTGGLPDQHGITGALLRNDDGRVVRTWSKRAPVSIIAGLGDDLDQRFRQRPKIGLVGTAGYDRGLIGGNWYIDVDRDVVRTEVTPDEVVPQVKDVLRGGFGRDDIPDLLGVAASGTLRDLDRELRAIVDAATDASGRDVAVIVTGTGAGTGDERPSLRAGQVAAAIEDQVGATGRVVEGLVPAGVFVDQRTLAREELSEDKVLQALFDLKDGERTVVADAFPGIAVSFARYC